MDKNIENTILSYCTGKSLVKLHWLQITRIWCSKTHKIFIKLCINGENCRKRFGLNIPPAHMKERAFSEYLNCWHNFQVSYSVLKVLKQGRGMFKLWL